MRQALLPLNPDGGENAVRARRSMSTAEAQRLANFRRSWKMLEMRIAVNFPESGSGIVGCATFDKDHRPRDRDAVRARFAYFRGKVAAAREKSGLSPPRMIWAPEVLTSRSGQWHVHFITDSSGKDYELLRGAWIYGRVMELEPLRLDPEAGYEPLARYLSKEPRAVQDFKSREGLHGWSCSRNCLKPEFDVVTVPDDYVLRVPEGCITLLDETRGGEFGEFPEIEFLQCL